MIDKNAAGTPVEFPTVIGADAVFKGELHFEKGVRVDGRIEGKVSTKGHLAVSQGGHLQADVEAGSIIVEGDVKGNLVAGDRVELRKSARLKGDVTASKLLVAEGAAFVGHCSIGPDAQKAPATPPPTNRIAEALPRK
ncbi:MAG TPA: polymer-forming cytoskeletal protein [Planctomycetota bacterium]|nr:polymer-forming cytoskeletal protein [Planctomycetota bacterium]